MGSPKANSSQRGQTKSDSKPGIEKLGPPPVDRPVRRELANKTLGTGLMGPGHAQNTAGSPCGPASYKDLWWVMVPCQSGYGQS